MYQKRAQSWLKHIDFILLDIIWIQSAFVLAYIMRHGFIEPYADYRYRNMAAILTVVNILVAIIFNSFKNVLKRGYLKELFATVRHSFMVFLFICLYLFMIQAGIDYSRITMVLTCVIYVPVSYAGRLVRKKMLAKKIDKASSLLIITTKELLPGVIDNIQHKDLPMYNIKGAVIMDEDLNGCIVKDINVVANKDNALDYICREWIDEVIIVYPPELSYPQKMLACIKEMGIVVHMVIGQNTGTIGIKQSIQKVGMYTVLTTSMNEAGIFESMIKRAVDIVGGIIGCIITGILFVFVAPAIYIKSPGPIFFKQTRIGRNGKPFQMYKFRSMYLDAEERKKELIAKNRISNGMMFKLDFDPRIIGSKQLPDGTIKKGIGNYIRDWSIDEFPQFFNVLKGDMSLVGTRPPTMDEWVKYEPSHRARMAIRPGITGMWQVSGRSNITDFEEVVRLDTEYITEWSIALDIKILLLTVKTVIKKDGSM